MRRIGILGGVGPQATAFIYQQLINTAQDYYGATENADYPDVLIASVPVPDFISDRTNIEKAKSMLSVAAKGLQAAGCEALCIGSNTVHILLTDLASDVSVPFISMVELVAERCVELGYHKVALLGTQILLESGLYDAALNNRNIELVKPNAQQIEVCDVVIRGVIAGKSEISNKKDYVEVLNAMFAQQADAIILGCTELPLVLDYEVLGKRILSSDVVLAYGMAAFCYGDDL
jgi:aspartate racemase